MRLLDATLAEAIPVHVACSSGATDVLVLMTRPEGLAHSGLSPVVARLTDRYLRAINPALVELRVTRSSRYDALTAELAARAADPEHSPAVCVLRPAAGALMVSQLESRVSALRTAGGHGLRSAWIALAGEDPELIGTLRAYPRGPVAPDRGDAAVDRAGKGADSAGKAMRRCPPARVRIPPARVRIPPARVRIPPARVRIPPARVRIPPARSTGTATPCGRPSSSVRTCISRQFGRAAWTVT